MSKEKRIAAALAKREADEAKRQAFIEKTVSVEKSPKGVAIKSPHKKPHASKGGGRFHLYVIACPLREDRLDGWSWGVPRDWSTTHGNAYVADFLSQYHNTKTWRETEEEKTAGKGETVKKKHVSYSVGDICQEAQNRLFAIKLDDLDEVFRFRITNKERLYGFIIGNTFHTLWFDPTHDIFPVG